MHIAYECYTYAGAVGGIALLLFGIVEFLPKVGNTKHD